MGIFRRKGFSIIRIILFVLFAIVALYLLFRGIINDNIVNGIK